MTGERELSPSGELPPSAAHGDFHDRPGFRGQFEGVPMWCPCDDPLNAPNPTCWIHGEGDR